MAQIAIQSRHNGLQQIVQRLFEKTGGTAGGSEASDLSVGILPWAEQRRDRAAARRLHGIAEGMRWTLPRV